LEVGIYAITAPFSSRGAVMAHAIKPPEPLEISPYQADGGELIGKDPREVPPEILSRYHREQNPLKALRARCLDCCCGNASEVRKCTAVECPSWAFRMGNNPFRQKRVISDEQKRVMAERLAHARLADE
jgi:hypothetical protein